MKNAWIILAFIFLLQPIMPVIDYFMDYDYISTVLCINKENTSMKCNGKCQLGKEMAKEVDDLNPKDHSSKKSEILPQLFFEKISISNKNMFLVNIPTLETPYSKHFIHNPNILKLIQPPTA